MSIRAHRVNKLEYDNSSLGIGYGTPTRLYFQDNEIVFYNDENPYQFELDVLRLKQFVKKYEKNKSQFPADVSHQIEDDGLIDDFKNQIKWADKKKETYLLFHEF